jgi:hypothetical protein
MLQIACYACAKSGRRSEAKVDPLLGRLSGNPRLKKMLKRLYLAE